MKRPAPRAATAVQGIHYRQVGNTMRGYQCCQRWWRPWAMWSRGPVLGPGPSRNCVQKPKYGGTREEEEGEELKLRFAGSAARKIVSRDNREAAGWWGGRGGGEGRNSGRRKQLTISRPFKRWEEEEGKRQEVNSGEPVCVRWRKAWRFNGEKRPLFDEGKALLEEKRRRRRKDWYPPRLEVKDSVLWKV